MFTQVQPNFQTRHCQTNGSVSHLGKIMNSNISAISTFPNFTNPQLTYRNIKDKFLFSGKNTELDKHELTLAVHAQITDLANAVFPIYTTSSSNTPSHPQGIRTGFLIENPKRPETRIVVTAAHGQISEYLTSQIAGSLGLNHTDFNEDCKNIRRDYLPYLKYILPPNYREVTFAEEIIQPLASLDTILLMPSTPKEASELNKRPALQLRDLQEEPLQDDESVFMIGRSHDRKNQAGEISIELRYCVEEGKVLSANDNSPRSWETVLAKGAEYFKTNLKTKPGDSGGPVFDKDGLVIGLVAGSGYVIKSTSIQKALDYIQNTIRIRTQPPRDPRNRGWRSQIEKIDE